jgi:hypothetical protein
VFSREAFRIRRATLPFALGTVKQLSSALTRDLLHREMIPS